MTAEMNSAEKQPQKGGDEGPTMGAIAPYRKIRVDEEKNVIFWINDDYTGVDFCDIWFTGDDYVLIKAKSREEARHWRRQGYGTLLRDTFEEPRDDTQDYLIAFVALDDHLGRRGLERHLCRQHGEQRSDSKDAARQSVISTQNRLMKLGLKYNEMSVQIAETYKMRCREAKLFARRLAKADEYVAIYGEDTTKAEAIIGPMEREDGPRRRMERRMSNYSIQSTASYDSRKWQGMKNGTSVAHPASPASPSEEYYAAIA